MDKILLNISIWVVLLPVLVGIICYNKFDKQSRLLFYLTIIATPPQLLTAFIDHTPFRECIYNLYTPIEFTILYFFIGAKLKHLFFKTIVLFTIAMFIILIVYGIITIGVSKRFLNEWVCAANISYLVWILSYILECSLDDIDLPTTKNPLFWYLSAFILYTPCTIFVFALYYYIGKSTNSFIKNLWSIQSVFNTLLYIFIAIGFYKISINENVANAKLFQ